LPGLVLRGQQQIGQQANINERGNRKQKQKQKFSHAPREQILTSSGRWPLALQGEEVASWKLGRDTSGIRGATTAAAAPAATIIIMVNANTTVVFRGVTC